MAHRVLIVPRWNGTSKDDFYPWLVERIGAGAVPGADRAEALDLPDAAGPQIAPWTHLLAARIAEDPEHTVLLGHSVGAQAALRALALLPEGQAIAGLLAVAGWKTVDEPWPTIEPWLTTPIDTERARRGARGIVALLSDDDPYTRDHEATGAWFRDALDARVRIAPGRKHFNEATEPDVLSALGALLSELGPR